MSILPRNLVESGEHKEPPIFRRRQEAVFVHAKLANGARFPIEPPRRHMHLEGSLEGRDQLRKLVQRQTGHITTIACSGHPWAIRVTTRLTVSAGVRRAIQGGAFRGTKRLVARRTQEALVLTRADTNVVPWPIWPLAGHKLGQHVVVGSMLSPVLALLGSMPRRSMSGPHFHCNCTAPRFSGELPARWSRTHGLPASREPHRWRLRVRIAGEGAASRARDAPACPGARASPPRTSWGRARS